VRLVQPGQLHHVLDRESLAQEPLHRAAAAATSADSTARSASARASHASSASTVASSIRNSRRSRAAFSRLSGTSAVNTDLVLLHCRPRWVGGKNDTPPVRVQEVLPSPVPSDASALHARLR
jgi:hypothetical protein